MSDSLEFIKAMNKSGVDVWIRQVIVPGLMDNDAYLKSLITTIKTINNIKRIDFLPYHQLGSEKYEELGIYNPYKDMKEMDKDACDKLYKKFMSMYKETD